MSTGKCSPNTHTQTQLQSRLLELAESLSAVDNLSSLSLSLSHFHPFFLSIVSAVLCGFAKKPTKTESKASHEDHIVKVYAKGLHQISIAGHMEKNVRGESRGRTQ